MSDPVKFRLVRDTDSGVQVTITCTTLDSSIYYTTDGTDPSKENGTLYTVPFAVSGNVTCKAIAVREGLLDSDIAVFEIKINDYKVMTPVITAVAG